MSNDMNTLGLDEIERRVKNPRRWHYDPELGWIDRSDAETYTLYLQIQAAKGDIQRANDRAWADEIEPLLEATAREQGMSPAWVLDRWMARRSYDKMTRHAYDERARAYQKDHAATERKSAPVVVLETKAADGGGTFRGYLAVYGNEDSAGDIIEPGAFTKTLSEHRAKPYSPTGLLPLLYQHDPTRPIGVFTDLRPDKRGLAFTARITNQTRDGRDALANVRAGVLSGMSIGFQTLQHGYAVGGARLLKEIRLLEGSLVTLPANPDAKITSVDE